MLVVTTGTCSQMIIKYSYLNPFTCLQNIKVSSEYVEQYNCAHFCFWNSWSHEDHKISFQTFFVWALLLIVHTWNYSPFRSILLRLQCTCCTVQTTSRRSYGSPLVWACQWPSSQPLSSSQLSHNHSLWA